MYSFSYRPVTPKRSSTKERQKRKATGLRSLGNPDGVAFVPNPNASNTATALGVPPKVDTNGYEVESQRTVIGLPRPCNQNNLDSNPNSYKNSLLPDEVDSDSTIVNGLSKHYYSDGSVDFLVGNTVYRIHRHIAEMTTAFTRALVPTVLFGGKEHVSEAPSDCPHEPLHRLEPSIKEEEVEALLNLLYTPFYAIKLLAPTTYRLALPLCIKWDFEELRNVILDKLEGSMDLLDRYLLARELHIPEWEQSCLTSLITRPTGLTLDEGLKLGIEAVIFITGLREEACARSRCPHNCASCGPTSSSGRSVNLAFVRAGIQAWLKRTN